MKAHKSTNTHKHRLKRSTISDEVVVLEKAIKVVKDEEKKSGIDSDVAAPIVKRIKGESVVKTSVTRSMNPKKATLKKFTKVK